MNALLSVSDKTGIVELAQALHGLGIALLSTGGTAKLLAEHGLPWAGLRSVVRVYSTREVVNGKGKGESSVEWRYYISSLALNAEAFNTAIRAHWGIENS